MKKVQRIQQCVLLTLAIFLAVGSAMIFSGPPAALAATPVLENANCPISGDPVNPQVTAVYQGKTYGFCCKGCVSKFKKNPEKYIAAMHGGHGGKEHAGHSHG